MIPASLTDDEKRYMLKLAREALEAGVRGKPLPPVEYDSLPEKFRENGASFVTLTNHGELRGCIGSIEAYQPLAEDIHDHAVAAALEDYRFPPVSENELASIDIEVSYLTPLTPLDYDLPEELSSRLKPFVDGVVLRDGWRRATFLPQVWEKIDNPDVFLSQLCLKMGAPVDMWRRKKLQVWTYQVLEVQEENKR